MTGTITLNPFPAKWPVMAGGLQIRATDSSESEIFRQFYGSYDRAFSLPDEKETLLGFKAALDLNHGDDYERLAGRYGPFREICCTFHDQESFVGGANFFATIVRGRGELIVTSSLNYIYVETNQRGQKYLSRMLEGLRALMAGLFSPSPSSPCLIFVENNDPFRMTLEQYRLDTETSGVDQFDRLAIWAKVGSRIVNLPYVQPPLSPDQQADNTLVLSVIGVSEATLSACVMRDHLARFFAVSVLKGLADPEENPEAGSQLATLGAICSEGREVQLLDLLPTLSSPGRPSGAGHGRNAKFTSLLELLTEGRD